MVRRRLTAGAFAIGLAVLWCVVSLVPDGACASWLSRLAREAGEIGGSARRAAGGLDDAGRYVAKLPKVNGLSTLAVRRETSGHWTFTNAGGETFTAASKAELKRVARVLAPEVAAGEARLTLLMPADTAFAAGKALRELPDARLRVLVGKKSYPLQLASSAAGGVAFARVRPKVRVPLNDQKRFAEAVFQIERTFTPSRVRVLSLAEDGGRTIPSRPLRDKATGRLQPDRLAPSALANAFAKIKGQTVVLTGRIEGGKLIWRTAAGAERSLELVALKQLAAELDIDLLVLTSRTPRQPGARNWLWQRAEVGGLHNALKRNRVADFLNTLADGQGELVVTAARSGQGRTALQIVPVGGAKTGGVTGTLETIVAEVASEAAGRVLTSGLEADVKDRERVRELDRRIIPGVPSLLQFAYLGALVFGIFGLGFARNWWFRIWPPEERSEYPNPLGYNLARFARVLVFAVLFLPVVGLPAGVVQIAAQIWVWITLPFRVLGWLFGRLRTA